MKAIVLTYAPVEESEKEILKNTKIFKIALNSHAEEFNPDLRICSDYILSDLCRKFSQKIVSVREKLRYESKRVEYFDKFSGSTIVSAIEYLMFKGYSNILIIGDNKVNTKKLQKEINKCLEPLSNEACIYQYTKGNFKLKVMSITNFCKYL